MKVKQWLSSRHRDERDVFKATQRHLTKLYSWQMMLFLLLFIVVVYVTLYFVILQTQERELRSMVKQEAEVISNYMRQNDLQWQDSQQVVLAGVEQFFYYVISPTGEVLLGDEVIPSSQTDILTIISENDEMKDVFQARLNLDKIDFFRKPHDRDKHELQLAPPKKDIRLLIANAPIIYKGQMIGTLYIGKDISFVYELLKWTSVILSVLAVLFFIVAYYISNRMSAKAMIPISQAFQRQREFVADASHELRTPLSVIQSSVDAIEMTIELDDEDDFVRKLLWNIKDEVKRMTHLVSDLLTLARSDSGKLEIKKESFDFLPLAQKTIDALQTLAMQKQIQLQLDAPETLIGQGDSERLRQLLYILIDNAIKYTQDYGEVFVLLAKQQDDLVMKVIDTGIGVKQEEQQLIFERFYRADKARSRQMGSFGLGLSIAKWIVDMHNGSIQVESQFGEGSTFVVSIPFFIDKQ